MRLLFVKNKKVFTKKEKVFKKKEKPFTKKGKYDILYLLPLYLGK